MTPRPSHHRHREPSRHCDGERSEAGSNPEVKLLTLLMDRHGGQGRLAMTKRTVQPDAVCLSRTRRLALRFRSRSRTQGSQQHT